MNEDWNVPGPGTAMALAAGAAAYGAGRGNIENEFLVLLLFVGATLFIELLHVALVPLGEQVAQKRGWIE